MKEYIERAAVLDVVKRTSGDYAAEWSEISHMPAADVAEVRHGRWEDKTNISRAEVEQRVDCSVCGQIFWSSTVLSFNYCPHCGALMKEDEHETG